MHKRIRQVHNGRNKTRWLIAIPGHCCKTRVWQKTNCISQTNTYRPVFTVRQLSYNFWKISLVNTISPGAEVACTIEEYLIKEGDIYEQHKTWKYVDWVLNIKGVFKEKQPGQVNMKERKKLYNSTFARGYAKC